MTVASVSETLSGMGRRLREIRLERGISLRELARRLELSPSAVSKIETGKMQPSVRTLHALVAEFDLTTGMVARALTGSIAVSSGVIGHLVCANRFGAPGCR